MPDKNDNRPKAVFCASGDPTNVNTWSGTPYYMLKHLEEHFNFVHIERNPFLRYSLSFSYFIMKISKGKIYPIWNDLFVKFATYRARKRILNANADIIFSAANSSLVKQLGGNTAVISFSDATAKAMIGYYPSFDNMNVAYQKRSIETDHAGVLRSLLAFYPSKWARDSAINDYRIEASKAVISSWGINMDHEKIEPQIRKRSAKDRIKLLFVGLDWSRKGGEIAVSAVKILNQRGLSCELHIVGLDAGICSQNITKDIIFHGRLSKSNPDEYQKLSNLFHNCDIYFMPTISEAWGMVFAEAAAYAMPSVSYATGGVTSVVNDSKSGVLLPEKSNAEDFADTIEKIINTPGELERLSKGALDESKNRLNWDIWAASVQQHVHDALKNNYNP